MKRSLIGLLLAVAILGMLFGGVVSAKDEVVTIQVAMEAVGNIPDQFQAQIERFNETHPNIRVVARTFAGGDAYNQALMGQVAGGVAPDVFLVDGGVRLRTFARAKAILELTPLARKADLKLSNFQDSLLQAFRLDGGLYGIPKDYNTTALFYHKDLLEAKGVTPPTNWEELREAARKLTTKDTFGFGLMPQINYFLPFIESTGASFVGENGVDAKKLVSEEHESALEYLVTLFTKDKTAASPQMVGDRPYSSLYGIGIVSLFRAF